MSRVEAIHVGVGNRIPMKSVNVVAILTDFGLEGDYKARAGSKRQVLVMPAEVLDDLGLAPGVLRENLTIRGFDVMGVPRGGRVRVGQVLLEATFECTPCGLMDDIRPGLQEELRGQRGMLFTVIEGGHIRIGDEVTLDREG